jgi:hypothetical protein
MNLFQIFYLFSGSGYNMYIAHSDAHYLSFHFCLGIPKSLGSQGLYFITALHGTSFFHFSWCIPVSWLILSSQGCCQMFSFWISLLVIPQNGPRNFICAASICQSSASLRVQHCHTAFLVY